MATDVYITTEVGFSQEHVAGFSRKHMAGFPQEHMFLVFSIFTGNAWQKHMATQNGGKLLCKPIPLFFPLTHGRSTW